MHTIKEEINMNLSSHPKMRSSAIFLLLATIISISSIGCSTNNTAVFTKPTTGYNSVLYPPWNPSKKVCVLPFDNLTKESDAEFKVMEVFLTELFTAEIFEDIVDPTQANAALLGLRIRKTNSLDKETIKALGEKLGAPYLILGTVTEYTHGDSKSSASEIGLGVRMIDVDTGNILWTGNSHKDGKVSFGRILGFTDGPNLAQLTQEACQQIISSLYRQIGAHENNNFVSNTQKSTPKQEIVSGNKDSIDKRR